MRWNFVQISLSMPQCIWVLALTQAPVRNLADDSLFCFAHRSLYELNLPSVLKPCLMHASAECKGLHTTFLFSFMGVLCHRASEHQRILSSQDLSTLPTSSCSLPHTCHSVARTNAPRSQDTTWNDLSCKKTMLLTHPSVLCVLYVWEAVPEDSTLR